MVEGVLVSPQEESRRQGFCLLMGPRCGRVVSRLALRVFQRGIGAGIVAARDAQSWCCTYSLLMRLPRKGMAAAVTRAR